MPTRKLIEVALPLEAINTASAREKSIRHGHPSTLHLWWARRPLAACRAVLFASLVDDPSSHLDLFPTEDAQQRERERLFGIIERLVKWENSNNEHVLREAREEILKHTNGNPPPVYDPFAGGGSIPLEAQRLGLEAHASDLNPVAVLINKALIEIPPRFANMPPVNPEDRNRIGADWKGAAGLAADVRYYGKWMRDEAEKRIGHLYPKVRLPKEYGGGEATVIAWLWARTVKCPNPACGAQIPLVRSFWLSKKRGKKSWVVPYHSHGEIHFKVETGEPTEKLMETIESGAGFLNSKGKKVKAMFRCITCKEGSIKGDYIDHEANQGRMSYLPLAIVAEGKRGRYYVEFNEEQLEKSTKLSTQLLQQSSFQSIAPHEPARGTFASNAQGRVYGFKTFADYFTPRQLITLITLIELNKELRDILEDHAHHSGLSNDSDLSRGGWGAHAYSQAIALYISMAISRLAMTCNSLVRWNPVGEKAQHAFGRQAIPMIWDFAEPNLFANATGSINAAIDLTSDPLELLGGRLGNAYQANAMEPLPRETSALISTDPPYYGNVEYADLSDFFYVWLRRSLGDIYPDLFSTILVPKEQQLVATPFRFDGNRDQAKQFFESGLLKSFSAMRSSHHADYPLTVYYAYKQTETEDNDEEELNHYESEVSTGWETMLEGLVQSGFSITGTWPIRTEMRTRQVAMGTNALASSIVLVCRPRSTEAHPATRREFLNALKAELPGALRRLQQGNIAPVDLAQAAIGPGMAVFSRYSKVVESDGSPMRVRTALQIINQELDAVLAEQEGEFDGDTRWAIAWFDQYGVNEGPYGVAETLSKAKNTSVEGMVEAGIVVARSGKVRLLSRNELPADWDPGRDRRVTVWEVAQHLVHALDKRGEGGAAALLAQLGGEGEIARDLAYRLYTTCERKGWAQEALAYNSLVVAWPEIRRLAAEAQRGGVVQGRMEI
jgi:putative DNA methylase